VNRDTSLVAIAIALAAWGVFRALHLPGLVSDLSTPLFVCYLMQAAFGIVAGVQTWRGSPRATVGIVALFGSIALTGVIEIALGIVPWLYAVLGAVAALVVGFLLSRFVAGRLAGRPAA